MDRKQAWVSLFGFGNLVFTDILVTRHHLCKKAFLDGHDYRAYDTHLRRMGLSDVFIDAQIHAASSGSTSTPSESDSVSASSDTAAAFTLSCCRSWAARFCDARRALVRVGYFAWRRQCRDCRAARG